MTVIEQALQRMGREGRRARKNQPHGFAPRLCGSKLLFTQFLPNTVLFEAREPLNEDPALEMIDFMLNTHRQQILGIERECFALDILRAHRHRFGAFHLLINARHRKAALLVNREAVAMGDFWIDQYKPLIARFGNIDHDHLNMRVDLGCGETDAGCRIHGFTHVIDQSAEPVIKRADRFGDFVKTRVGITQNIQ